MYRRHWFLQLSSGMCATTIAGELHLPANWIPVICAHYCPRKGGNYRKRMLSRSMDIDVTVTLSATNPLYQLHWPQIREMVTDFGRSLGQTSEVVAPAIRIWLWDGPQSRYQAPETWWSIEVEERRGRKDQAQRRTIGTHDRWDQRAGRCENQSFRKR